MIRRLSLRPSMWVVLYFLIMVSSERVETMFETVSPSSLGSPISEIKLVGCEPDSDDTTRSGFPLNLVQPERGQISYKEGEVVRNRNTVQYPMGTRTTGGFFPLRLDSTLHQTFATRSLPLLARAQTIVPQDCVPQVDLAPRTSGGQPC